MLGRREEGLIVLILCAASHLLAWSVAQRRACARHVACACLGTCLLVATFSYTAAEEVKQVMLLFSFGREFKPWSEYARTIRTELDRQSPWPLDITEHSLVTARAGDANAERAFLDYLRALYAVRPDLIVSIGAPAAAFVQQHREQLFRDTPMVLTAVERRRVQFSTLTENDAVVAVRIDYLSAMQNILNLLPQTRTIAVVVGASPVEQFWRKEIENEVQPLKGKVRFVWYDKLPFSDILKDAANLPRNSAIFWELMSVDAAGVVHEGSAAMTRLHAVTNAPIFSYDDSFFGSEIVGGPLLSVPEGSRKAAAVAVRILGGEKAAEIKSPFVEFAAPKFNWKEMQRWGIDASRLPPGSEIYFRDPGAWELYRAQIVTVIAVILIQAGTIAWLLYEHGRRRRSEAAAHGLSRRLIGAQEEERARLARELHDDVTQRLAVLAIDIARDEARSTRSEGRSAMHSVKEGLIRLSEDVHALSYRLHPSILNDLGLVEALRSECESFSQHSTQLKFDATHIPEKLPHETALCLFRVAQEALRNAFRHAGADRTEVELQRANGGLRLAVHDNGTGFNVSGPRLKMSLGLASMRHRVESLGGRLDIVSSPGHGTTISAWVPLRGRSHRESDQKS